MQLLKTGAIASTSFIAVSNERPNDDEATIVRRTGTQAQEPTTGYSNLVDFDEEIED